MIKRIINKNKRPQVQTMFKLRNGNETSDSKCIPEKFDEFFINIVPTLAKGIPDINKSPLHHMGNKLMETLFLFPVDIPERKKIIMSLKNSAAGFDDIEATLLKFIIPCIVQFCG